MEEITVSKSTYDALIEMYEMYVRTYMHPHRHPTASQENKLMEQARKVYSLLNEVK